MSTNYRKYIIGRTFIKGTEYEYINTGRKKKATKSPVPSKPMTAQELDLAYHYRQRAKREHLVRLADVNFEAGSCVFVTLTFRENLQDYDLALKSFKSFTKCLRRKLDNLKYIATLETQQRGAYHFHLIVNCETVQFALDNLVQCWHNGIVDVQAVDNVKKAVLYMTKDMVNQGRNHPLYGRRCYFVSQGLEKFTEVTSWNSTTAEIQSVEAMLQGKRPNKHNVVNSAKAGLTEYRDYYLSTQYYSGLVIATLKTNTKFI